VAVVVDYGKVFRVVVIEVESSVVLEKEMVGYKSFHTGGPLLSGLASIK
jgi:hypothetical protein